MLRAVPRPQFIPSPHHPLHGFRLKLNRAQTHADALNREVETWAKSHPYEVFGEYEPGPPEQYVFRVRFFEPPPASWGVLLGDFAHNARAALDHLVYRLACLGNNGEHVHGTKFPIVLSPFDWHRPRSRALRFVSDRHVAIIESFQPYHRADPQEWHTVWKAIDDPLAILNRLANIDKHVVLNATPATLRALGWDVVPVRDIAEIVGSTAQTGILVDEGEMVRATIVSSGPNPELKLYRNETLEIGVQHRIYLTKKTYTLATVPVKESVEEILARLGEIFQIFVGEFQ